MSSEDGESGFKVTYAQKTDIGKAREINEDSKFVDLWSNGQALLAVVADGLGGHNGGEQASGIAVDVLKQMLDSPFPLDPRQQYELLLAKLYQAHNSIGDFAAKHRELDGMGTTIIAAIVSPAGLVHLYAGDCRLYLFRQGHLVYRTQDHTVMQVLMAAGSLTEEQAKTHPMRSTVTSCLGAGMDNRLTIDPKWQDEQQEAEDSERDVLPSRPDAQTPHIPLESGDILLLSSDGFHGEVPEPAIEEIVQTNGADLQQLADLCIEAALENGGPDNITVVIVRYWA